MAQNHGFIEYTARHDWTAWELKPNAILQLTATPNCRKNKKAGVCPDSS
jgi:hypothetical protein